MFLIRLIRFLRGYVIFTCSGGFPERFINLCSLNGINLWDVRSENGALTAKTSIRCYKHIRPCAKKSGMKIKIKNKHGFPFFIRPYIQRKGISVGMAVSAVMLIFLCSCVWTIDVTGNERFTEEQILSIAESYGIYPGAFRKNIDPKEIKTDIKSEFKDISWFSVNINGGNISLEVTESTGSDEIIDFTTPCNIVSGIDGELLSLEAHSGTPAIKPGNAVTKGDLLISGVMEKTDGSPYFTHARGTAVIRTNRNIALNIPYNTTVQRFSNVKKFYTVSIFGINIPLGFKKDSDMQIRRHNMLKFRNTVLPVGIITDTHFFMSEEKTVLTHNQAILLSCFSAFTKETEIMKNAETESKTVQITNNDNSITLTIDYINHETTGIENYFETTTE